MNIALQLISMATIISDIEKGEKTMIKIIEIETDDDFNSCDDCVYSNDIANICKMRGCIHAIATEDIKECYIPKKERENNEHY